MIILAIAVLFLLLLFVYMICPNKKRVNGLPSLMYAHRGLHGNGVPENSLSAFILAKERKLGVELDVQLTLDKKLVVFHDDNLKRMCGVDKKISELTWNQLKKFRLNNTDESIPLFSEVLNVLDGMPVICEIKSYPGDSTTDICGSVSREISNYKGFVCIESFNPFAVQWFRKKHPDILRGQLSMNFMKNRKVMRFIDAFLMTHLLVNFISRPDFIAYRFKDCSFGYFLCRKLFHPIIVVWTLRSRDLCEEMEKEYQGIIFEEIQ